MGIPHFVRRLKETGHGTRCELGWSNSKRKHTKAIIDGPGLAYYIYNQRRKPDSHVQVLIDLPGYQECISKTIEFLDKLESYGFEIEAVFFDGGLPDAKAETRIDRMKKCSSSLAGFKILHDNAIKAARSPKVDLQRVLRSPDLARARRDLPAPPFLVPSLVEGLLQSRHSNLVFLVPGEADPYCAALGRLLSSNEEKLGVMIFTNDSDLIVFDSGARTTITMLNDLEENSLNDQNILKSITFCPSSIAGKLHGSGLTEIAWLMSQDSHASFNELSSQLPLKTGSDEQSQFIEQYLPTIGPSEEETYISLSRSSQRQHLAGLDARVAEVIHQMKDAQGLLVTGGLRSNINTYLPFILEDPSSASAWEVGADSRLAAYTVLHMYSEQSAGTFREYKRSGRTITDSSIDSDLLVSGEYIQQISKTLDRACRQKALEGDGLSDIDGWGLLLFHYVIDRLSFLGKPIPGKDEFVIVLGHEKRTDWRTVQLSAYFEAAYYSLRMLLQIIHYIKQQRGDCDYFKDAIDRIASSLEGLPPIARFFGSDGTPENDASAIERKNWAPIVERFLKSFREQKPSSAKRKRKNKTEGPGKASKAVRDAGNPFAALSEE